MKSINQIFYYGLGGPDKNYKVLNYEFIVNENYINLDGEASD